MLDIEKLASAAFKVAALGCPATVSSVIPSSTHAGAGSTDTGLSLGKAKAGTYRYCTTPCRRP